MRYLLGVGLPRGLGQFLQFHSFNSRDVCETMFSNLASCKNCPSPQWHTWLMGLRPRVTPCDHRSWRKTQRIGWREILQETMVLPSYIYIYILYKWINKYMYIYVIWVSWKFSHHAIQWKTASFVPINIKSSNVQVAFLDQPPTLQIQFGPKPTMFFHIFSSKSQKIWWNHVCNPSFCEFLDGLCLFGAGASMEHPKSQDARHASKVNTSPRRPRSACSVRLCKIQRLRSQLAEPEVRWKTMLIINSTY